MKGTVDSAPFGWIENDNAVLQRIYDIETKINVIMSLNIFMTILEFLSLYVK